MSTIILPPGYDAGSEPQREVIRLINLHSLPPAIAPYADADRIRGIFDAAETGQTDDYFRMVAEMIQSDPDLIAALTQRKAAFVRTPWALTMPKAPSLAMQRATDYLRSELEPSATFADLLPHMPTGGLWPVAAAKWCVRPGDGRQYRWRLDRIAAAPWPLLDYAGNATRPPGTLGIKRVSDQGQFIHGDLEFPEPERGRPVRGWIVHRGNVLADFPDAWGGPIRAAVMWWFFSLQVRQVWVNYCERGSYFLEGQHEANDTAGREALLSALSEAQRLMAIAVSSDTNLKVHNLASASGGQIYENFLKFAANQCVKVVLGSTMTVNAAAGGFGGGNQSAVQADAVGDIFGMDAALAGRTLRSQLLQPLLSLNGMDPAIVPDITWGTQTEDQVALADTLLKLDTAGYQPTNLGEISERLGIAIERKPAPQPVTPRTFATNPAGLGTARRNLLSAAAQAGTQIDSAGTAALARAGREQFADLAAALLDCETADAANAACDSWLATFNAAPVADSMAATLAAHSANGATRSAVIGSLP